MNAWTPCPFSPMRLSWLQHLAEHGMSPWSRMPRNRRGRQAGNRTWRTMATEGLIEAKCHAPILGDPLDWYFAITDAGRAYLANLAGQEKEGTIIASSTTSTVCGTSIAGIGAAPAPAAGWVSVEERLPEKCVAVLVYVPNAKYLQFAIDEWVIYREDPTGMGGPTIETGEGWGDHDHEEVTHWMPLGAPASVAGTTEPEEQ